MQAAAIWPRCHRRACAVGRDGPADGSLSKGTDFSAETTILSVPEAAPLGHHNSHLPYCQDSWHRKHGPQHMSPGSASTPVFFLRTQPRPNRSSIIPREWTDLTLTNPYRLIDVMPICNVRLGCLAACLNLLEGTF